MIATLTSKGQITLPKRIRDELRLDAGAQLDFSIQPDGTLSARPLQRSVSNIVGLLHRPGQAEASVEQMNQARDAHLATKHQSIGIPSGARPRPAAAPKRRR